MLERPTAQQLDENIWFSHRTLILPENGIMIPGALVTDIPHPGQTQLEFRKEILRYMPTARMTLHWFPQGIVADHAEASYGDHPYLILEKAAHLKKQLYGGYAEDFWLIGPYQLSSQAFILVPVDEFEKAKKELIGFKGIIIGYASQKELKLIVEGVIRLHSIYSIQVPRDQKKKYSISVESILNAKATLFDSEMEKIKSAAKIAQLQGFQYIEVEEHCPPQEIRMIVNGRNVQAADFFSAWYSQGLVNDSHDSSIFWKFEQNARVLFLTVNQFFVKEVKGMEIEELPRDLTITEYQEAKQALVQLLVTIKEELIARKFPAEVISYFTDQFEINFREWLSLLNEQITRLREKQPSIVKEPAFLRKKIEEITDKTGETSQEKNNVTIEIKNQTTAALLKSKLKDLTFTVNKDKVSHYVNIECKIATSADFEKCKMLRKQLLQFGVVCNFVNGNSNILPEKLVIPKMNTAAIQNNIRKLINR